MKLPTSITKIGTNSFRNTQCQFLGGFENVESIGNTAFENCSGLNNFNFPKLKSLTGFGHFYNSGVEVVSNLGEITYIPSRNAARYMAFGKCVNLTKVVLPTTCVGVGNPAESQTATASTFEGCVKLKEINLEHVEFFCQRAFYGCESLDIDFVNHKVTWLVYAFAGSGIRSFDCPNLREINYAF
jgi:hypothetical protein